MNNRSIFIRLACLLYVSASRDEKFGIPFMKEMACSKPVLASDIPAHKEILSVSGGGMTFWPADKNGIEKGIRTVLDHKELIADDGRKFAEEND